MTPALVGEDGGLIAGHARILAARQLGIAEIPVMVAAGWTDAGQLSRLRLRDPLANHLGQKQLRDRPRPLPLQA